jgi:hypothetical protein
VLYAALDTRLGLLLGGIGSYKATSHVDHLNIMVDDRS